MSNPRVFCIGMFKTGTSSLGRALDVLGYKTLHGPWWPRNLMIKDDWYERPEAWPAHYPIIQAMIDLHEAFEDYPWMFLYERLDQWVPDARFILTVREDPGAVADSDIRMLRQLKIPEDRIRSRAAYIERYLTHRDRVLEYFGERDNLLVLDIVGGDGWSRLCPFLGRAVPELPFPHVNRANSRRPTRSPR
jgi:hypothetical protein